MATKEELLEKVKKELDTWGWVKGDHPYNTGYGGRYDFHNAETVSRTDFDAVVGDINTIAKEKKAGCRGAASYSGQDHNEWSLLVEFWGQDRPSFNFHIRIAA